MLNSVYAAPFEDLIIRGETRMLRDLIKILESRFDSMRNYLNLLTSS